MNMRISSPSRFAGLVLVLTALTGSVAHADPPAAPAAPPAASSAAPAPAPNPRDRFAGSFVYVGGEREIAAKDAAIEKATDSMFFATRGIARGKLRDRTEVRKTIGFSFSNGNIVATAAGTAPAISPETGASANYKTNDGSIATLSQRITPDGRITQSFSADGGTRTAVFTLSADGTTISAAYTIQSSKIPQPVHYTLTYRRN